MEKISISFRSSIENHHSMQIHVIFLPHAYNVKREKERRRYIHARRQEVVSYGIIIRHIHTGDDGNDDQHAERKMLIYLSTADI